MKRIPAALLLVPVLLTSAAAGEFGAGHLLVCSPDSGAVRVHHPSGTHVAAIGATGTPHAAEVGPDGLLYVVSSTADSLFVMDSFGTRLRVMTQSGGMLRGLTFSPGGTLYVGSDPDATAPNGGPNGRLYEFDRHGALLRTFGSDLELQRPVALATGLDGNLFVGDGLLQITMQQMMMTVVVETFEPEIVEIDPAGHVVRRFDHDDMSDLDDIVVGPDRHVFAVSAADRSVFEFDELGGFVGQFEYLDATPTSATFGPDGKLHVLVTDDATGGAAVRVLGEPGNKVTLGYDTGRSLRYVPLRFDVKLSGLVARDGPPQGKGKGKQTAIVSFDPGAHEVMVAFADDSSPFATFFGDWLVMRGWRAFDASGSRRTYQGTAIAEHAVGASTGSVVLDVKGKTGSDGQYNVKRIIGQLMSGDGGEARSVRFKTGKPLN